MTVKEMITFLRKMPPEATLVVEVEGYYWQGDRYDKDVIDEPALRSDGTVQVGTVFA